MISDVHAINNKLISPVRTKRFDFTYQFLYLLSDDHKIYIKSLNKSKPIIIKGGEIIPVQSSQWQLFEGTGIPSKGYKHPLVDNISEYITEISVASEILIAISNKNQVFLYQPTKTKRPTVWSGHLGKPLPRKLYLPNERRSWAFCVSIGDKLNRRLDIIDQHERALYYNDGNGIAHDYGFTGTLYVLMACGRKIMYWDTGLPPSFSRGFLSPLEGTTQGQEISAAGSVVFISAVDNQQRLRYFTRIIDYEICGSAPGFHYSYIDNYDSHKLVDGRVPLGHGVRKLPNGKWLEHSLANINPELMSSSISIHLTGQGNSRRQLRILGRDKFGNHGYYHKMIDEPLWYFQPVRNFIAPPIQYSYPFNYALERIQKNYQGQLIFNRENESNIIKIILLNFSHLNTAAEPATLILRHKNESVTIKLHTVDGWGISSHKYNHENLIGSVFGEAKVLRGTLIIDSVNFDLYSTKSILQIFFTNYILSLHGKTNKLQLLADDATLRINANDTKFRIFCHRKLSMQELGQSYYIKQAMQPELRTKPYNEQQRKDLITNNNYALLAIKKTYANHKIEHLFYSSCYTIANIGRAAVKPFSEIYFHINNKQRKIPKHRMGDKALQDVKYLFSSQAQVNYDAAFKKNSGYEMAKNILKNRINSLERCNLVISKPR